MQIRSAVDWIAAFAAAFVRITGIVETIKTAKTIDITLAVQMGYFIAFGAVKTSDLIFIVENLMPSLCVAVFHFSVV